jgi:hypothetical protein
MNPKIRVFRVVGCARIMAAHATGRTADGILFSFRNRNTSFIASIS